MINSRRARVLAARLLARVEPALVRAYRAVRQPPAPNLLGDRDVEYAWVAAHLPDGPGRGLDFGSATSGLPLVAAERGLEMTAVDLGPAEWAFVHPGLTSCQVDLFDLDWPAECLDLVISCSAVEHVGLGRYGDARADDGDLQAMARLRELLRPGGLMLLTVPVGQDAVVGNLHRVYGSARLPRLLDGFSPRASQYWLKGPDNRWYQVSEDRALASRADDVVYGLGCFALERLPSSPDRVG